MKRRRPLRPDPRRTAAAGVLMAAAAAGAILMAAARGVVRAAPFPGRSIPGAALDAVGIDRGQAALLLAIDPGCEACVLARTDLPGLELGAAGVFTAVVPRSHPAAADLAIAHGPYPLYVLVDGDGRIRASRRGYVPPSALRGWARHRLLALPGGGPGPGCRPTDR